ncbi:MAG TPA: FtsL-like putative cell division protein [Chitinophagales bacterium]|nr:hypothetical protein [Bacteroidota bacterium]HRX22750.1 FtsL-like putative cell division protein [Chitinophagales bacterium]
MTRQTDSKRKKNVSLAALLRNLEKVPFLQTDYIASSIPFFIFLLILGFFYIWNNHRGVTMVKDLRNTEQQMTEAQWEFNDAKNELTRYSRQSTVAERVRDQQMYELTDPPYTIIDK